MMGESLPSHPFFWLTQVQNYQDMGCGSLGKSIAAEIAQCIPPRQLLKDLFSRFEQAQVEGKDSLVQLMELVGIIASKLNPKSATSYGDQVNDSLSPGSVHKLPC